MGRDIRKLRYVGIFFIFLLVVYLSYNLFKKDEFNNDNDSISFIEDFSMKRNGDNGSTYQLIADKAYFYIENGTAYFDNCSFIYNDTNKKVTVVSLKCSYKNNKEITANGPLKIKLNDKMLITGENKSFFIYYLPDDYGEITGGVVARQENSLISSDKMLFKKNEEYVNFSGKVEVKYEK